MSAARWLAILALALTAATLWGAPRAHAKEGLPDLRRKLLEAQRPEDVGRALDRLQERVGEGADFADEGAFADWLGDLPDGRAGHPVVLQRRGWGYMRTKRGAEGIPLLQRALEDDPSNGLTAAYLAECLRQADRLEDAVAMMARAAHAGFEAPYLDEGFLNAITLLRARNTPTDAEGIPAYARVAGPYLLERPSARTHALLACWLVEDTEKDAKQAPADRTRLARRVLWTRAAGEHALTAARDLPADDMSIAEWLQRAAHLALGLGSAGAPRDRADAFALLSAAVRRAMPSREGETHRLPSALLDLADLALDVGRPELAARLLRMRQECGPCPRTQRIALRLPPDLDPP